MTDHYSHSPGCSTDALACSAMAFSDCFVVAWVIGFAIQKTIGFRITNEDEIAGVDQVVHGEEGYALADA